MCVRVSAPAASSGVWRRWWQRLPSHSAVLRHGACLLFFRWWRASAAKEWKINYKRGEATGVLSVLTSKMSNRGQAVTAPSGPRVQAPFCHTPTHTHTHTHTQVTPVFKWQLAWPRSSSIFTKAGSTAPSILVIHPPPNWRTKDRGTTREEKKGKGLALGPQKPAGVHNPEVFPVDSAASYICLKHYGQIGVNASCANELWQKPACAGMTDDAEWQMALVLMIFSSSVADDPPRKLYAHQGHISDRALCYLLPGQWVQRGDQQSGFGEIHQKGLITYIKCNEVDYPVQ